MKEDTGNHKGKRRRELLNLGVTAGVGITLGAVGGAVIKSWGDQKVRLITADGKVVEVDRRHLPDSQRGKLTNSDLKKWMTEE